MEGLPGWGIVNNWPTEAKIRKGKGGEIRLKGREQPVGHVERHAMAREKQG